MVAEAAGNADRLIEGDGARPQSDPAVCRPVAGLQGLAE